MRRMGDRWVGFVLAVMLLEMLPRHAAADTIPADKLPEAPLDQRVAGPEGEYLRKLHAHIHARWADNFLRLVGEKLPPINPLNDSGKTAEAEMVVSGDGQLISAQIIRGSGFPGFDDAIIEVLRDAVPFPSAPQAARSDDDRLHVRWAFARDQRRCSGVTIQHVNDAVEVALPKLLRSGRREEALRRLAMGRSAGQHAEPHFTMLANDWIKAAIHQPAATVELARLVAAAGDPEGIKWLKSAVRRPEEAADAGAALVSLKVPLCPLLAGWFETDNWSDHRTAALALATSPDPACVPGLTKVLSNTKAHPEARAAAATALGSIDEKSARQALAAVGKEDNVTVRAAAMLALVRPGAGRRAVILMEASLRDPSPEIRAAAAAGVVRAGGDTNLDDLYVLFKDNDPRPAVAALRELENVRSEEGTKLVARLARRPHPAVQKLAAEILIRRNARDYYVALRPFLGGEVKTDPEVRALALVAGDEAALKTAAGDPRLGLAVFRARLARGERDQAADWFLSRGSTLTPADQAGAMTTWISTGQTAATAAQPPTGSKPSAAKTPAENLPR